MQDKDLYWFRRSPFHFEDCGAKWASGQQYVAISNAIVEGARRRHIDWTF